ncbi:MAG: hypothetical protein MUD14_23035 [Hydrococcus sp. Prado102]|jgi:hypothetical protein|nr:hypothetical protein [Hydrococcus sp. Prado102]
MRYRLFIIAIALTACSYSFNPYTQKVSSIPASNMSSQTDTFIKQITLVAKEEKRPALGIPQKSERDIGFASVFLRLENSKEEKVNLLIKTIEIRHLTDAKSLNFNWSIQEISLKPLENSEVVFDLTNKTGYIGQDKVKAFVTYQIGEQVHSVESEAVEVKRR